MCLLTLCSLESEFQGMLSAVLADSQIQRESPVWGRSSAPAFPWSRHTQRWGPPADRGRCTPCTAFSRLQRPGMLCQDSPWSFQSQSGLSKNPEKVRPEASRRRGPRWLQDDTLHVSSISGQKRDRRDLQSPLKQQEFSLQEHGQPGDRIAAGSYCCLTPGLAARFTLSERSELKLRPRRGGSQSKEALRPGLGVPDPRKATGHPEGRFSIKAVLLIERHISEESPTVMREEDSLAET